jgi:hypothetical protein
VVRAGTAEGLDVALCHGNGLSDLFRTPALDNVGDLAPHPPQQRHRRHQ